VAAEAKKKRDQRAGVEPSVRVFTTWTPSLLRSAEMQADSGNLRFAANLCDWLLGDDRVASTLNNRVQALLGLEPSFEASGDKRRSNRAVKALDAQEDWWAGYPETELAQILAWGILLGCAPAQHSPEFDDARGRLLPKPTFWHPQHLRFDWQYRKWMIRVATSGGFDSGVETELVPGDGTWLLHTPYGRNRPWALGRWRGLARLVLLKQYAISDWARRGERNITLVATEDNDDSETTKEQRRELAQEIYDRGRDAAIVLPAGFDLKLLESVASGKALEEAQIELVNTAIAINLRGGNLTTEVKTGSLAATQQQATSNDQVNLEFDATSLTTTVREQSLVWWAEWNYGDRNLAPWPVYPVEPEKDRKAQAETANTAADVVQKFENQGFVVDRKEFAQEFGLDSWLKPGEKAKLPTPGTPPAPGQPGQPPAPEPAPKDPTEGSKASGFGRRLRLASGMAAAAAKGFIDGQLYADALTEIATAQGIAELESTLTAIREEIDAATDYEDLRARLRRRYQDMDAQDLSDLVEAAMTMGELAGRAAVNQDA
jgi:phage gp29-like protein